MEPTIPPFSHKRVGEERTEAAPTKRSRVDEKIQIEAEILQQRDLNPLSNPLTPDRVKVGLSHKMTLEDYYTLMGNSELEDAEFHRALFEDRGIFYQYSFDDFGIITPEEWNFLNLEDDIASIFEAGGWDKTIYLKDFFHKLIEKKVSELNFIRGLNYLTLDHIQDSKNVLKYYSIHPEKLKAFVASLPPQSQSHFASHFPFLFPFSNEQLNTVLSLQPNPRQALEPEMTLFSGISEAHQKKIVSDILKGDAPTTLLLYPPNWISLAKTLTKEELVELLEKDQYLEQMLNALEESSYDIEDVLQLIMEVVNRPEAQAIVSKVFASRENHWKLSIDPDHQSYGPMVYDYGLHGADREDGYLLGMKLAWVFLTLNLISPSPKELNFDDYNALHNVALSHWIEESPPVLDAEILVDLSAKNLDPNFQTNPQLLKELEASPWFKMQPRENGYLHILVQSGTFEETRTALEHIFETYNKSSKTLRDIAHLHQQLERRHYYQDGNTRTNLLVLQGELIKHGFSLTHINPNRSYLETLENWEKIIAEGMK